MDDESQIKKVLKSIGLNETEINIYLDLVKYNSSSALEISKRIKFHRSNTYDSLRKLIEKGFVAETIKDNKKIFNALDPEKIKNYIKHREQKVDSIILKIKNLGYKENKKEIISVNNGIFALRNSFSNIIKLEKPIKLWGGVQSNMINIIGEGFIKNIQEQLVKKKIKLKRIYVKNINELHDKKGDKIICNSPFIETRYFSKEVKSYVMTVICEDIVLIIIFIEPILTIEIKNQEIAKAYNQCFELLWKHANEYP